MVGILTQISDCCFITDRQLVYIINKLMADCIKVYNIVVGWLNGKILPIANNGS